MRRFLAALVLLVGAGAVAAAGPVEAAGPAAVPTPAAKGGWALASFDSLPALVAGETVDVTFRILQHGVHPVDPASWPGIDLHLDVTGPRGTTSVPAVSTGGGGRYTAHVDVPHAATVGLTVVWPGGLLLESNAIDVPVTSPGGAGRNPDRWPIGLGALALAAAALVAVDVARDRARRRPGSSPRRCRCARAGPRTVLAGAVAVLAGAGAVVGAASDEDSVAAGPHGPSTAPPCSS